MALRHLNRTDWLSSSIEEPSLGMGDGYIIESIKDDLDSIIFTDFKEQTIVPNKNPKTTIIADMLETVRNPVHIIKEANRVTEDRIYIVTHQQDINEEFRRTYTGKLLFDQCLKAGINPDNIKIDHLNEQHEQQLISFWLATIDADTTKG